jgi:hypothetical protein
MTLLINETSRLSQLTPAGLDKLAKGMAEYKLRFDAVTADIRNIISGMSSDVVAESAEWYEQANGYALMLSGIYDVTPAQVAGIISAVSPRMSWQRNKSVAESILNRFRNFDPELSALEIAARMELGLHSNVAMAVKIARGEEIAEVLSGTKRRSFYNNIIAPDKGDSVTVDTWMGRTIMRTTDATLKEATDILRANYRALGGTGVGYYVVAESVRTVAKEMNLSAASVQAIYWVGISGSMNGGREDIGN